MDKNNEGLVDSGLVEIDNEINKAKLNIKLWILLCLVFFVGWIILWRIDFYVDSPAAAGIVGDYFGGLVNPVVALLAFYWLTKGVRMQQKELSATRVALDKQVAYARTSTRIDALSSMINAHTSDITYRREHLSFLADQKVHQMRTASNRMFISLRGRQMTFDEAETLVKKLNEGINGRTRERARFAAELHQILQLSRLEAEEEKLWSLASDVDDEDDGAP